MKGRILVVDDQAGIRMLIKEVLELESHQVETVSTGEDFFNLLKQDDYDFMIVDLLLPGYAGSELLTELNKYASLSKAMVISGIGCPETREKVKKQGVADYMEKPFDLQTLKEKVQRSLEQITA
ncbi:response regulator [Natranaerobius thermophilus]|uniref:Stage 0 sporulation protein A homolog n=1 Tax=Natranaerobius thermophilus (strain ATCC BAA-1301 / DSM 18059 / JW/NM-WN-LF) TaxID=457570 RepID=B2A3J7_NATTJ|nr:response regulator [Natranaerobius thermophilus]ACB86426.1 response regulator receiver protein [Natranaerobius thermophilus JW/NM-WN-LF]